MSSEKNVPPTQKKIRKAHEEGNFPKSERITMAATLVGGCTLLAHCVPRLYITVHSIQGSLWSAGVEIDSGLLRSIFAEIGVTLLLFLCGTALCGVGGELLQRKKGVPLGAGVFTLSSISIKKGFGNITSGIKECWLPLLSVLVFVGAILAMKGTFLKQYVLYFQSGHFFNGIRYCLMELEGLLKAALCSFVILGVVHFIVKIKKHMKSLMMSLDEVRREHKESEGDSQMKYTRKALHQALIMQKLEYRIKHSKCVIVERAGRG